MTHPFIENFEDYEAVLRSTNEIPAYAKDTVIRAFQTYQFMDATTVGDDVGMPFVHTETGAIIHSDGDVLAIDYGVDWVGMLPDLVLTLHALGWQTAEALHPPETMSQFLQDLGRAIPAHVPFDVVPAQTGKKISDFPAAQSLLNKTRQLTGAAETLRSEFESLTPTAPLIDPNLVKASAPVHLVDDQDPIFFDDVIQIPARQHVPAAQPVELQTGGFAEEEPPVVSLETVIRQTEPERTFAAKDLSAAAPAVARSSPGGEGTQSLVQANQPVHRQIVRSHEVGGADDFVELGNSLLFFNTPKHQLTPHDLGSIAGEYSITHIRPGTLDPAMRWDVLGEIPDSQPWFAERLVTFMRLRSHCNASLIAALMLATKSANRYAQLRDVIDLAMADQDAQAQALAGISKTAETMLKQATRAGSLSPSVDALIHRIGGIALAPSGAFFLDIRTLGDAAVDQCFTLRSMASEQEKCAYVMHIDAQDGHFIDWICLFMRDIAKCISASGSSLS